MIAAERRGSELHPHLLGPGAGGVDDDAAPQLTVLKLQLPQAVVPARRVPPHAVVELYPERAGAPDEAAEQSLDIDVTHARLVGCERDVAGAQRAHALACLGAAERHDAHTRSAHAVHFRLQARGLVGAGDEERAART